VTTPPPRNTWNSRAFVFGLLAHLSLVSCASANRNPNDPDNNLVEFQLIDADTMKPIQGAYVNAIWVSPTPAGKVNGSQCLQAALLRSDANGWVKMDGPKDSILEAPWIMVPGYESLRLTYFEEPKEQVHIISMGRREYEGLEAWGRALQDKGYELIDLPGHSSIEFRKSFNNIPRVKSRWSFTGSQRYFVTNRSPPGIEYITNVANACGPEGINIGLSEAQRAETGIRRGLQQVNIICDERWDTAKGGYRQGVSVSQALWLVEDPMENSKAWARMLQIIPNYDAARIMTRDERMAFCAWIQPFAEKQQ